jgi:ADP-ribose pyrophosphatase YjhB (NUDIX family)/GNAT superfamily N-acetyltransferase
MPIPAFVQSLRAEVGQDLLFMVGVTAVVRNDRGEILLGRRADTGGWALVSGILEPGEQPAPGLLREIEEETGVRAKVLGLSSVWTMPEVTYPNGDRAQYLDLCFVCAYVDGEARVNDDESLEVGWFAPEDVPEISAASRHKLDLALAFDGTRTWFEQAAPGGQAPYAGSAPSAAVLATLPLDGGTVTLRRARRQDIGSVVELLAGDQLGATREDRGDLTAYLAAFDRIDADPAQVLAVAEDDGAVVGTFQLTLIPGLARNGAMRAQLEAVRVARSHRGRGLGQAMFEWAIAESRSRGCALVQLTTDKTRVDAHRFYERLGFTSSHEGYKLRL